MAKNVLNMILWHPEMDIDKCNITYVHRGAPGNLKKISCSRINNLERGFLIFDDETQIPCHRIVKIEYNNQVMWNK
jgi:uncharacterized protein (UPF0248 family)